MTARDITMSAAGNAGDGKTYIEDVFSTYLYTGNGSTQTITNGIDLAGKGGMVWVKGRGNTNVHILSNTVGQVGNLLQTQSTDPQYINTNAISGFTASGFSIGLEGNINTNGSTYASWTFRKAPKFFDVVTYTGSAEIAQTGVAHSLGITPGLVIIKKLDGAGNWGVKCRYPASSSGFITGLSLNQTNAALPSGFWSGYVNETKFYPATISDADANQFNDYGSTYVAYLFAHDTTTDGLIQCGSFTSDASGNVSVNLGWEPQYLLFKRTDGSGQWYVMDTMRGYNMTQGYTLYANLSNAESTSGWSGYSNPKATGFEFVNSAFIPGQTYIYMAIRRGPMRTPTDATKVFNPIATSAAQGTTITTSFPVDTQVFSFRDSSYSLNRTFIDRLRGTSSSSTEYASVLRSSSTAVENLNYLPAQNWNNTGFNISSQFGNASAIYWNFRRAPGFFDVVCYTGTGTFGTAVAHNLGVAPEMIILKSRSAASTRWPVYHKFYASSGNLPESGVTFLNTTDTWASAGFAWANTAPTATQFSVGFTNEANGSGQTYVAYLFASCPGVSKVGSYTGNGSSQTINCGFTNGARFVMIKRTNIYGDWYVWDTARGIVAATDPHLSLNTTDAEVTTDDTIDPDSTGFKVNQDVATNVNVSDDKYIYLAIA